MLLLWMVAPATSYTCSLAVFNVSSSASPGQYNEPATVGPRPVLFSRNASAPTLLFMRDGNEVPVSFGPLTGTPLVRVNGLALLVSSQDLSPGDYCAGRGYDCTNAGAGPYPNDSCVPYYDSCFTVVAALDASEPVVTASLSAFEKVDRGQGCGNSNFCGSTHEPRRVQIFARTAEADAPRVAGYVADIFWGDADHKLAVTNLFGAADGDGISLSGSGSDDVINKFDGLCAQLTPVLWDGSLKASIDLGCQTFQ